MNIPSSNRLVHAYIIASRSDEARRDTALELSAALVCGGTIRPCRDCRDCRKAFGGRHPDIIFVTRESDGHGKMRREIYVDQIREIVSGASVMSNEARRKVYVIEDAGLMNLAAQNALLKILEEPPGDAAFILCADLASSLLPTIRSRCVELSGGNTEPSYPDEASGRAREFADLWLTGDAQELFRFCAANEAMSHESLLEFLECAKNEAAVRLRSGAGAVCMELVSVIDRALLYARHNVGTKLIFGLLSVHNKQLTALGTNNIRRKDY